MASPSSKAFVMLCCLLVSKLAAGARDFRMEFDPKIKEYVMHRKLFGIENQEISWNMDHRMLASKASKHKKHASKHRKHHSPSKMRNRHHTVTASERMLFDDAEYPKIPGNQPRILTESKRMLFDDAEYPKIPGNQPRILRSN